MEDHGEADRIPVNSYLLLFLVLFYGSISKAGTHPSGVDGRPGGTLSSSSKNSISQGAAYLYYFCECFPHTATSWLQEQTVVMSPTPRTCVYVACDEGVDKINLSAK